MPTATAPVPNDYTATPPASRIAPAAPVRRAPGAITYVRRQPATPPTGRAKQVREACSVTWRDDLTANRDKDYAGRLTGPGTRKVRCVTCGKAYPPQYVATGTDDAADAATCATCSENDRAPADRSEPRPGSPRTVPVLGLPGVARVPLEQLPPIGRPTVALERVGYGPSATYEPHVRPTGSLAVAMSPAHMHLLVDVLPSGGSGLSADADEVERAAYDRDGQALAAELAAFTLAVMADDPDALVRWMAGADDSAGDQAYRAREAAAGRGGRS